MKTHKALLIVLAAFVWVGLRKQRVSPAILGLTILCSPVFSADHQTKQAPGGGRNFSPMEQQVIELGSTEFASAVRLPAAAGGNVHINVRVTLRISQDVVKRINEGISSGKYRAPFGTNKDFMDLVLSSNPGSFEVEFLHLNQESRFYYFFEQEVNRVKAHPSIPNELRRKTSESIRNAKQLLYQTIRFNDYIGSKIIFEQDSEEGRIVFLGSTKRWNILVGRLNFTHEERPIFEAMKNVLSEDRPRKSSVPVSQKGSFDDIIKSAQKKNILISKE